MHIVKYDTLRRKFRCYFSDLYYLTFLGQVLSPSSILMGYMAPGMMWKEPLATLQFSVGSYVRSESKSRVW